MKNFFLENKIAGFVFDMDGVLLDSESVYEKAWRVVSEEMGLSDIDSLHKKCLGVSKSVVLNMFSEKYVQ